MIRKVGKIMSIVALIIGVIIIGGIGAIWFQNQIPQIELGLKDGRLKEIPDKDNAVSTQTKLEKKQIDPLPFIVDLETSKEKMLGALNSYGGIEIVQNEPNYIYAIATTGKVKFHDDIEIYFDEVTKLIHYRSASRAGYSDMGLNRARYEAIQKSYNSQVD